MTRPHQLVLLHTMDPRGDKLGGIETHVRLVLARHPLATTVLLVGVDETGDLALGARVSVAFDGRQIDFLPVAHVEARSVNGAAKSIGQSTTLRYALGVSRHLVSIRREIRRGQASCEIERFEFAVLAKALALPLVLLVHNEGTKEDKMDSLLKRYWFLHLFNERVALTLANRIFAVNASIANRIGTLSPRLLKKTEVMSVSVDTQRFAASPFDLDDKIFRVCFAGRLDAFKDPPLMFRTLARLAERICGSGFKGLEFHYVGASDPTLVPEFEAIAAITTRHGPQKASAVAAIMAKCHAGIVTSFFEGMPCYVLELLATGRPVAAIALPQFAPLILPGRSGVLVDRAETPEASAEALASAMVDLARRIASGALDPMQMRSLILPYSVDEQMVRLFRCHAMLAAGLRYEPSVSTIARYSL